MSTWAIPSYAEWAVPGYAEDRLLGHGVSGRVVSAVNESTGQRVAIKYLNANLLRDNEFLADYRAEAEQLTSLDAAHVVRVFDFAEQPGEGAAVVMELVEGVSLRQMIARLGPLSAVAALVVLKDSLLGLAAAHSRRIPHRDLKPDNVLIDAGGWCTLTDFGLAVKTDKQMPAPGAPEYMAPEVWNGSPNVPATDVYSATAVFCESLTGKPPFSGRSGHLRDKHETAPVPLDRYDPQLRDLIGWGLAKYPDRRPPSARAFVSELDARATAAYGPYWEEQGRRELGERAAELLPLLLGVDGGGSATATRLARRKMIAFVSIAAAVLVLLAGAGAYALSKSPTPVTLTSSSVSASAVDAEINVTPPLVVSKCKTPTTFNFTGSVTSTQKGPVSYQWVYSSGPPGPVQTLNFTGVGQLPVTAGKFTTSTAGDGWAELKMLTSPASKTSSQAQYSLLCSGANGDITVSSKVTPATTNFSSCTAPHPTLTATGTITSKNAGVVTFYWAMSNGTKTTPVQLIFSKAGTQAANPLTFQAWVPASGSVVLVVTKPALAASTAAAYTVTCTPPAQPTPTAASSSPKATKTSASPSASKSSSPSATATSPSATPTTPTPTPTTPTATPTIPTPTATPPTGLPTA